MSSVSFFSMRYFNFIVFFFVFIKNFFSGAVRRWSWSLGSLRTEGTFCSGGWQGAGWDPDLRDASRSLLLNVCVTQFCDLPRTLAASQCAKCEVACRRERVSNACRSRACAAQIDVTMHVHSASAHSVWGKHFASLAAAPLFSFFLRGRGP